MKNTIILLLLLGLMACTRKNTADADEATEAESASIIGERWSKEKAWAWYNQYDWLAGCNFNPSTAINSLEFWQEETFDPKTIDRELGWSADLGLNLHRVYLHNLLWDQDSLGFLKRFEEYLAIADNHGIKTMVVLLDDVWHPVPKLGKQPDPVPHLHNSGWVQAPGAAILGDSSRHDELKPYIKGVISHFANDERVIAWDLYNEPGSPFAHTPERKALEVPDKHIYSLALLRKAFAWAREVNPSQPLSSGIWWGNIDHWDTPDSLPAIDRFMIMQSDFISFHSYDPYDKVVKKIEELRKYDRPMICTEYMARGNENRFDNIMVLFKQENIGAINWGFVAGKTQTQYPWSSWEEKFTAEPEFWHHEILRKDGTPYSEAEIILIKELTGK